MAVFALAACSADSAQGPVCRELAPEEAALEAHYAASPQADARTAAYVQAAKDLAWASATLEQEIADACRRIGMDLGLAPAQLQPQTGPGGAAIGACDPVNARIDALMREGVRLWVTLAPPECKPNANAYARCAQRCDVRVDPFCAASCKAHAEVHANCTQAQVHVRTFEREEEATAVIATLQANLPRLVQAHHQFGERLGQDLATIRQAGAQLPASLGDEARAKQCAGASVDAVVDASTRARLSLRASGDIVARVQGQ